MTCTLPDHRRYDQAVKMITRFYRNFHSSRFVKDLFVIRLKHAPTESAILAMNEILPILSSAHPSAASIRQPDELEDEDTVDLPRIGFGFNRRDYGVCANSWTC